MPRTRTAALALASPACAPMASCARTASKMGWRALYTPSGVLLTLSALARLLAVVFRRTDCADMPEPAISNALNDDMAGYSSATGDRGEQPAELVAEEGQRRLVAHCVLGEGRLLQLRVDGVAVERRRQRRAVLEVRAARGIGRSCAADVPGLRGAEVDALRGLLAGGTRHGFAEVDVAGLVARRVGVREVVGDQLGTAPAHVERGGVYTEILIETGRHDRSSCRRHRA